MRGLKMKGLQPVDRPVAAVTIRPSPPSNDDDAAPFRSTARNQF